MPVKSSPPSELEFAGNGELKGSTEGLPSDNASEKVWSVAQALGDIAFSLSFSIIFLEIQVHFTSLQKIFLFN